MCSGVGSCVYLISLPAALLCVWVWVTVWVCVHTAHFGLMVDSYLLLPHSVKDRGDLGGKERGT